MSQLRQRQTDLDEIGVDVWVVTFEDAENARDRFERLELPWPVVLDPDRRLYIEYGMDRAPLRRVWGLRTLLTYARLLSRGRSLAPATGDTRQRGGDVIIDPDQIVRQVHVGDGPADRPSIDELLATCRR